MFLHKNRIKNFFDKQSNATLTSFMLLGDYMVNDHVTKIKLKISLINKAMQP
jgi:hypothetical protein